MEKEFKKIIKESKKSLEKAEEKIEDLSEDFTEEVSEFWVDLKKRFSKINDTLKDAYDDFEGKAELKGHLGIIEARDTLEQVRESAQEFTQKVSGKAQAELDIASLKAHLAKMEGEDLWEEKQKELSLTYDDSKTEVEELARKAGKEITNIFLKLTDIV